MRPRIAPVVVSLVVASLFVVGHGQAQRGVHSDPELGIKVRAPANWVYLGDTGDLGSLRALYCSPRSYAPRAGRAEHTPTMRVLWFPAQKAAEASADKKDGFPRLTPYASGQDYIARVYGPTTKVEGVEATTIGKLSGRQYVASVPRENGASLTLFVGVAGLEGGGEIAIEYEVLTEHFAKLKPQFVKSLATLTTGKREAPAASEVPPWIADRAEWRKLPAAERKTKRDAWGKAWLDARKKVKEDGFKQSKNDHYLILSRADSKFTKRLASAIDVIYPWAMGWLKDVSDEAVMPAVVRVFDDRREYDVFHLRDIKTNEYQPATREIHVFKDASVGNTGAGFSGLVRGVFQQILHDKHPLAQANLPRWLDNGLWAYMDSNNLKGKKLEFFPSEVEIGRFDYHKKNNTHPPLWGLIQEKSQMSPKDGAVEEKWGYTPECARLFRWFEEGGTKYFEKQGLIAAYLWQVGESAAQMPDPTRDVDQLRLTPDDAKKVRTMAYEHRDKLLEHINNAVIPIPILTWQKADEAFKAYNAAFKPPKR